MTIQVTEQSLAREQRPTLTNIERFFEELPQKEKDLFTILRGNNRVIAISKYSIPMLGRVCLTSNSMTLISGLNRLKWDKLGPESVDEIATKGDKAQRDFQYTKKPKSVNIPTMNADGNMAVLTAQYNDYDSQDPSEFRRVIGLLTQESENRDVDTLF